MAGFRLTTRKRALSGTVTTPGRRTTAALVAAALVAAVGASTTGSTATAAAAVPAYQDTTLPFSVRAADMVSRMTMEEKIDQLRAMQPQSTFAAKPKTISRLGLKSYGYWGEANHGIYFPTLAGNSNYTQYPQAMSIASTWNTGITQQVAQGTADEARVTYNTSCPPGQANPAPAGGACYGLTYWSPNQNLNRDPRWGRSDESYSEDPALTAGIASAFVTGMQGSTTSRPDTVPSKPSDYVQAVATPKHYLANNSEANRNFGTSNLTERSMLEYFTQPFAASAGKAGARSAMTAYNAINVVEDYTKDYPSAASFPTRWSPRDNAVVDGATPGTPGTPMASSRYAIETLLRRTFGFDGFVVSDCDAITRVYGTGTRGHTWKPVQLGGNTQVDKTAGNAWALKAGTDLDCSGADYPSTTGLNVANDQGYATESDIDTALVRTLTARFQMGEFDPVANVPWNNESYSTSTAGNADVKLASNAHRAVAHEAALEAPVLLKNQDSTLPLTGATTGKTVALGYVDNLNKFQSGSYSGPSADTTTFAQALAVETGAAPVGGPNPIVAGSAAPYISDHLAVFPDAITTTGTTDAITTSTCASNPCDPTTSDANTAEYQISKADNVIVVVGHRNNDGGEGTDRTTVALPRKQAELIRDSIAPLAAKYGKKVTVWIQGKTIVDLSAFKDLPNVGAIAWSSFNGMYQGAAMSQLLFNDNVTLEDGRTAIANFSGKLPMTWYSNVDAQLGTAADKGIEDYRMTKAEGSKCGRTYLYYQVSDACAAPDYPFGYGLSYSPFAYGTPTLSSSTITPDQSVKVSVPVTNQRADFLGKAVVEVYAKAPTGADGNDRPLKQLKGFVKTGIVSGTSETADVTINAGDLWFWDATTHKKVFPTGDWTIMAGPSSADADLKSVKLTVTGTRTPGVEVVSAQPDDTELNLDTPDNRINADLSVTKHDSTFWDLSDPALKVVYTSSNPAVAKVDGSGAVAPVATGAALITATATANGETKSTDFPVVVTSGAPDATDTALPNTHTADVNFADRSIPVADATSTTGVQLSANLVPAVDGTTYSYRIPPMDTNTAGAAVTPAGVFTATKPGHVRVTVTSSTPAGTKTSESALIRVVVPVSRAGLQTAVTTAKGLDPLVYTTSSFANLTAAVTAAQAVLDDPSATQAQVDAATSALGAANAALVKRGDPAVLSSTIAAATELSGRLGSYTPESASAFTSALSSAQEVYSNRADRSQAQLDAAVAALQAATAGLVPRSAQVDKTVLQSVLDSTRSLVAQNYTSESWAVLQQEAANARAVLADTTADQARVDAAVTRLSSAVAGLRPAASATAVSINIKPAKVVVGRTKPQVKIEVRGADGKPVAGSVVVEVKGQRSRTVALGNGKAKVRLRSFAKVGKVKVVVTYLGDSTHAASTSKQTFTVKRR